LAEYILRHHLNSLRDGFELAVVKCLSMVRGYLSPRQAKVLLSIWKRLQEGRAS
jgi:hypothetical protein